MRADGRRIKSLDPLFKIIPYIMPRRYDAQVFFETELDYTKAKKYINKKRKEGIKLSFMSLFIASYVRVVSQMPEINRFIVNKKIYARNEVCVSFVVLKIGGTQEDSLESVAKVKFELTDTIYDVAKKIDEAVIENRKMEVQNLTAKLAKIFMSIPLLPGLFVLLFKFFDKIGILPKAFLDGIPFHTGLFITNMGSINMGSVFHHLFDFGTTSIFVGMGKIIDKTKEGKEKHRVIPIGVGVDERICAGATFAKESGLAMTYLANPEQLETPPDSIREDIK